MILRFLNFAPILLLIISMHVFTPLFSHYYYYWDYYLAPRYSEMEVFDFIVVGAGSAGSVVANRLSKNNKVLLIEAGGDPPPFVQIPLLAQELIHMPHLNFNYKTIPQKYSSQGMKDKVSMWPRGKALGGSSNLNFMIFSTGNPLDYDNWASIAKDDGWKFENLLPYFRKSLDYNGAYSQNKKHYGNNLPGGYLHVENRKDYSSQLVKYFLNAAKELGYDEIDLNGPQSQGFGISEVTQKKGSRCGTFVAFLKNFMNRKNLHISRYSHATKIKLDSNNRAEGVWYVRHGKRYFARASKEVIISSGSIGSPILLMHSNIGPKEHLKSLNIKTKLDLPVGKNLKDHISVMLHPFVINETLSAIFTRDFGFKAMYEYFFKGNGPLTSPALLNSYGFISSKFAQRKDWPDLQIYLSEVGVYSELVKDGIRMLGFNATSYHEYLRPLQNSELDAFGILVTLVLPKSVGDIRLKDTNYLTPPLIDPKYLENEQDVKTLIEGIKFSIKMAEETESFKKLNATLYDLTFPECKSHVISGNSMSKSDAYWECFIRHTGFTLYHPVGTCRMGAAGDPNAVVDSKLRVLGTPNLRVADISIAPEIVNGNTNAPAIMVGERASDLIRQFWSEQYLVCCYNFLDFIIYDKSVNKCHYSKIV